MKQCGFALPGKVDQSRLQQATKSTQKFSDILIAGFDGAHWANWFLLRAAIKLAENATVILHYPSDTICRAIDLCWIGSWEEICGEAQTSRQKRCSRWAIRFSAKRKCAADGTPHDAHRFSRRDRMRRNKRKRLHANCVRFLGRRELIRRRGHLSAAAALCRVWLRARSGDSAFRIMTALVISFREFSRSPEWQAWLELATRAATRFVPAFSKCVSPDRCGSFAENARRQNFENVLRETQQRSVDR